MIYLLLLALHPAFATTPVDELVSLLSPRVFSPRRELITFHYEATPTNYGNAYRPRTVLDLDRHLAERTQLFFNPSVADLNSAGPGIYVALEPTSSRNFGGEADPQLYVIPLRRDARLLDTRQELKPGEVARFSAVIKTLKCQDDGVGENVTRILEFVKVMRQSENVQCRSAVIAAARRLDIQGILYSYNTVNGLAGCRDTGFAINLISNSAFQTERLGLFGDDVRIEGEPVAAFVNTLFHETKGNFAYRSSLIGGDMVAYDSIAPKRLAEAPTVAAGAYASWKNARVYGCGRRWPNETREDYLQSLFTRTTLAAAPDVQEVFLDFKRAYFTRVKEIRTVVGDEPYLRLSQMNYFERVQGRALGFHSHDDFLGAKRAIENMDNPDEKTYHEIERLLGEDDPARPITPMAEDSGLGRTLSRNGLIRTDRSNRELFKVASASVGFGPKLASLLLTYMLDQAGGELPASVAAARDFEHKDEALQARNKEDFKRVLRECAAVYRGPLKLAEIVNGPCWVRQTVSPGR